MRSLAALLPALLLAACSAAPSLPAHTPTTQTLPNVTAIPLEAEATAAATPAPLDTAQLAKAGDRSRYAMDVVYDYERRRIQVAQVINYLNQSTESLEELLLVVEGHRLGGEFQVSRIAAGETEISGATLEDDKLWLPLPAPLAAGERLRIAIDYSLRLPDREGPLGYSARQQNWADWYPFLPPYQAGEGWQLHPAAEVGEHLVYESADFLVRINVESEQAIALAAPAPVEEAEGGWQYSLENARRFAWSASPDYLLLEDERDGIPIRAYVFAEHEASGRAALEAAGQALALYSELFGPYPYQSLSLVEGDFPDGMESDALFWLFNGFFEAYNDGPQNYLTSLSVHEVAHNWWFGQVGNDAAQEPWLDETLCTFSELLFYQDRYPNLVAWWWRFRVLDYAPVGLVDSTIYDHEGFAPYVQAVYLRGALFMEELRMAVGAETYQDFLAAYAQASAGRILSSEDFFDLLDQFTDTDISPVLEDYFGEP